MLHRAATAALSLPTPSEGTLRYLATDAVAAALASLPVGRRQTVAALSEVSQSAKKRPFPTSPSVPSPSNLPPLAQRIRKDIQVGESEVESPEKEVLRGPTFLENSPPPLSPGAKGLPSPVSLVCTPVPPEKLGLN